MRIDASVSDQAALPQALQGGQQVIVDVVLAGAVQLVDIEVVQAEIAQRGFATGGDRCGREVALLGAADAGLAGQRAALAGDDQ
ncbi:hypothetical protein D3C81_1852200 [compost metagenome]